MKSICYIPLALRGIVVPRRTNVETLNTLNSQHSSPNAGLTGNAEMRTLYELPARAARHILIYDHPLSYTPRVRSIKRKAIGSIAPFRLFAHF